VNISKIYADLIHAKVIEEDHHINELMGYVEEPHIELEKSQLKMMGHYLRLWSIMHKLVHSPKEGGRISEKVHLRLATRLFSRHHCSHATIE
jgi:UTP-glucose-1-phosphate uridylyltransferase